METNGFTIEDVGKRVTCYILGEIFFTGFVQEVTDTQVVLSCEVAADDIGEAKEFQLTFDRKQFQK